MMKHLPLIPAFLIFVHLGQNSRNFTIDGSLLDSAGVTLGKALRGKNFAKYILAVAADGYEVIFSLPEIDLELTDNVILFAAQVDGKPLALNDGPLRLVVPNDKKHARWIRQLSSIKVLYSNR